MTKAIKVQNLTRDHNGLRAVDGIGFAVQPEEIFGFLGPSGAGTLSPALQGHLQTLWDTSYSIPMPTAEPACGKIVCVTIASCESELPGSQQQRAAGPLPLRLVA